MIGAPNRTSALRDTALAAFILSFTFVWGTSYVQGFENSASGSISS
jgi:hypothetical protein